MKITFLGATQTVTGSKFLIESKKARVLIDCGLFQGLKILRLRNWKPFPFSIEQLNAVILTHAHIDHSGALPLLVKNGYSGPVYSTPATAALCELLLPDAGHLQEEEARYANKKQFSKHHPALPLYTIDDAKHTLPLFRTIPFEITFEVMDLQIRFVRAGHILGAACVYISDGSTSVLFTGDVGRPHDPVMHTPSIPPPVDYLVVESTYGDRRHKESNPKEQMGALIRSTVRRKGVILIPSFAVGRAQQILHFIAELRAEKKIPGIPVYLNSPMAINATKLFCEYHEDHQLNEDQYRLMNQHVTFIHTEEDSRKLNEMSGPMIIISASGMATGGRILHHLKTFGPDEKNMILFVGFQAAGTRGEALLKGADQIKIHGQYVPIRAEVRALDNLSAHADCFEMIEWLRKMPGAPKQTFIVHGEPNAQDAFRRYLKDLLSRDSVIPGYEESFVLS